MTQTNLNVNTNVSNSNSDIKKQAAPAKNTAVSAPVSATKSEAVNPQVQIQTQPPQDIYEPSTRKKSIFQRIKENNLLRVVGVGVITLIAATLILEAIPFFKRGKSLTMSDSKLANIWQDVSDAMSLQDMGLSGEGQKLIDELDGLINHQDDIIKCGGKVKNASILMHGPAGTGKTSIARAIAKRFPDSKFAVVDITHMGSEYQSVTERNLNAAFNMICDEAKKNPNKKIFVFFDEIDSVIMENAGNASSYHSNQILNVFKKGFVDQFGKYKNIIPIAATNYEVDPTKAMLNHGKLLNKEMVDRFGKTYLIDLPSPEQFKFAINKNYHEKSVSDELLNEKNMNILTKFMSDHGLSFRDLESVENVAANRAVKRGVEQKTEMKTSLEDFYHGIASTKEKFVLAPGEANKDHALSKLAQELGIQAA